MTDELQSLINGYYSAATDHYACGGDFGTAEELNAAESDLEDYIDGLRDEAFRQALNSLCLGVDATEPGAGVSLMSYDKATGVTTVLATGYTKAGQGSVMRVSV